jgi:shikimate 5-dehydrogenase
MASNKREAEIRIYEKQIARHEQDINVANRARAQAKKLKAETEQRLRDVKNAPPDLELQDAEFKIRGTALMMTVGWESEMMDHELNHEDAAKLRDWLGEWLP